MTCDGGAPTRSAFITCDSGDASIGVSVGDTFVLGTASSGLGAQTDCAITSGGVTQHVSIHTSCSKLLESNDVYGALMVKRWSCDGPLSDEPTEGGDDGQSDVCNCHPSCLTFQYSESNCSATTQDQSGKFQCSEGGSGFSDVCECHPRSIRFTYVGGECAISNAQSGKATCNGGVVTEAATIMCTSGDSFSNVAINDVIELGAGGSSWLGAQTTCTVMHGSISTSISLQTISIHTSCSKTMAAGDMFGALRVDSWDCGYGDGFVPASLELLGHEQVRISASSALNVTTLQEGDHFTLGCSESRLPAQSDIYVENQNFSQHLSVHTSCSKPLAVGDTFGSVTLVGYDCDSSSSAGMGMGMGMMSMGVVNSMDEGAMSMMGDDVATGGCDCHPVGMRFAYAGGDCTISNPQGGKASCMGGEVTGVATISCDSGDVFAQVAINETIQLGGAGWLGAQTECTVDDGTSINPSTQSLSIHTSCSKSLFAGDVFGALVVESWDCGDGEGYGFGEQDNGGPATVLVSFFADGYLVGEVASVSVPLDGGAMTCDNEPSAVAVQPEEPGACGSPCIEYQQGEAVLYGVAVPDSQVPAVTANASCQLVPCAEFPPELASLFDYFPPGPDEPCGSYVPVPLGTGSGTGTGTGTGTGGGGGGGVNPPLCVFNPLCTIYSSLAGRIQRLPLGFDPSLCVTCYCAGDAYCTSSGTMLDNSDSVMDPLTGQMSCGTDPSNCQPTVNHPEAGCMEVTAINYQVNAIHDDGSCICEFGRDADQDDGSCVVPGCTDPVAPNFNDVATVDDGSCIDDISPVVAVCAHLDSDSTTFDPSVNSHIYVQLCSYDELILPPSLNCSGMLFNLTNADQMTYEIEVGIEDMAVATLGVITCDLEAVTDLAGNAALPSQDPSYQFDDSPSFQNAASPGGCADIDGSNVDTFCTFAVSTEGYYAWQACPESCQRPVQCGGPTVPPTAPPSRSCVVEIELIPVCLDTWIPPEIASYFVYVPPVPPELCGTYENPYTVPPVLTKLNETNSTPDSSPTPLPSGTPPPRTPEAPVVPLGQPLCTYNPLCSLYMSALPSLLDTLRLPRRFDLSTCVTCYCTTQMFCPYNTQTVNSVGEASCGSSPGGCVYDPIPPTLTYCVSSPSGGMVNVADSITVNVCADEELISAPPLVTCNGVTFGCTTDANTAIPSSSYTCEGSITPNFAIGTITCDLVAAVQDRGGNLAAAMTKQASCGVSTGGSCDVVIDNVPPKVAYCPWFNSNADSFDLTSDSDTINVDLCSDEDIVFPTVLNCRGAELLNLAAVCPPVGTGVDYGRCGPLFGGASCGVGQEYCNETSGECGASTAHRDAQASTVYDYCAASQASYSRQLVADVRSSVSGGNLTCDLSMLADLMGNMPLPPYDNRSTCAGESCANINIIDRINPEATYCSEVSQYPHACAQDVLACPPGPAVVTVSRNPALHCAFDPCPDSISPAGDNGVARAGYEVKVTVCASERVTVPSSFECNRITFTTSTSTWRETQYTAIIPSGALSGDYDTGNLTCNIPGIADVVGNPMLALPTLGDGLCSAPTPDATCELEVDGTPPVVTYCISTETGSTTLGYGDTYYVDVYGCTEPLNPPVIECNGMTLELVVESTAGPTEYRGIGTISLASYPGTLAGTSSGIIDIGGPGEETRLVGNVSCTITVTDFNFNPPAASPARRRCGDVDGASTCEPHSFDVVLPSPSMTPSPSVTPSASPSTTPIYQMRIVERNTLCVTENCINYAPWDNYTTRINMWYEKATMDTTTGFYKFVRPNVADQIDVNISSIGLYSKVTKACYNPPASIKCQIAQNPLYPQTLRDLYIHFCTLPCNYSEWVPGYIPGYQPQVLGPSVYPNFNPWEVIGMVVDCKQIFDGIWSGIDQTKVVTFPIGTMGGPCWDDPDAGQVVCAPGSVGPPVGHELMYDIHGNPMNMQRSNYYQTIGEYPRYLTFNCPKASAGYFIDTATGRHNPLPQL